MLSLYGRRRISHKISLRNALSAPVIAYLAVAFAGGVAASHGFSFSFILVWFLLMTCLMGLALSVSRKRFLPFSVSVFFLLGILFGTDRKAVEETDVSRMVSEGALTVQGTVRTVPEWTRHGKKETVSFQLACQDFYRKGSVRQAKGRLQVFLHNPDSEFAYGDFVRLRGVLESPKAARNPHAFDYAAYLKRNGIRYLFRGIGANAVVFKQAGNPNRLLILLSRLRVHLKKRLDVLLPSPGREIAAALVLGFRKDIPRHVNDDFIRTGTAHLLAISGIHITLVAALFYAAARLTPFGRAFNLIFTMIGILGYVVLAGARLPVLRAGIMGIVVLFGLLIGRERSLKNAFFFSFLLLLVWKPENLFLASFQLSFIAVASLLFLLPEIEKVFKINSGADLTVAPFGTESDVSHAGGAHHGLARCLARGWHLARRSARKTLTASLAVSIGMFPVLAWYFHLFSPVSFAANLIVIPLSLVNIAQTFILLITDWICTPLAELMAPLAALFYRWQVAIVYALGQLPFGYFYVPALPKPFYFFYYFCLIAWRVSLRRPVARWIRSSWLILLCGGTVISIALANAPEQKYVFFDLGKSHSMYASFSDRSNCLINSGRHFPNDQAYWVLRPFFAGSGIQKLDSVFLTQTDASCAGGLQSLRRHVRIQTVWAPQASQLSKGWQKYVQAGASRKYPPQAFREGDEIRLGSGVRIRVLAASGGLPATFLIQDQAVNLLYLGSANRQTFDKLKLIPGLACDILFIPAVETGHITAPAMEVLERLGPRFIVTNQRAGADRMHAELERLRTEKVFFLQDAGAVEIRWGQGGWEHRTYLADPM